MRLFEIMSPAEFWDTPRQATNPEILAFVEREFEGKTFPTEASARAAILRALQNAHKTTLFKNDGSHEQAIAAAAPVYHDGQAFRIGTHTVQPKITWKEIKIKPESRASIADSANANAEDWECDWKVHWFNATDILPSVEEDSLYQTDAHERQRIEQLAAAIRENRWVTPLFVGMEWDAEGRTSQWVIEGQHRARALYYHLGLQKLPGYLIEIDD